MSESEREAALAALVDEAQRSFAEAGTLDVEAFIESNRERCVDQTDDLRSLLEMVVSLRAPAERDLAPSDDAAADRVGPYELIRELGRGGMGRVHLARDERVDRVVALKRLHRGVSDDATFLERFRRESRATARLRHPGIVALFEANDTGDVPYYAMEYVDGVPLDRVLQHIAESGSKTRTDTSRGSTTTALSGATLPLIVGGIRDNDAGRGAPATHTRAPSATEIAAFMHAVASAIAHAHERGVLHRDLKPGNILVDESGQPRILDFGICRMDDDADLTKEQFVGTLRYAAPEQVEGRADERTDVYAIGLVLYELLTLRHAFEQRERVALVRAITSDEPKRPRRVAPSIPRDLETIARKAYAKLPDERYPSARAMARDLESFMQGRPISARPPSAAYLVRLFVTRHWGVVGLAAGALVAISVLAAVYVADLRSSRRAIANEAFRARLAAASAALSVGEPGRALRSLESAPEPLRGFGWQHLHARADQSLWRFEPFAESSLSVNSVRVSPTAPLVLFGGEGGAAVWDLESRSVVERIESYNARHVAWAEDGASYVVAFDHELRWHELGGDADEDERTPIDAPVSSAAVDRNGIAWFGALDGSLRKWDRGGDGVQRVTAAPGSIDRIFAGPIGNVVAEDEVLAMTTRGEMVVAGPGGVRTSRLVESTTQLRTLDVDVNTASIWIADEVGSIRHVDLESGRTIAEMSARGRRAIHGSYSARLDMLVTIARKESLLTVHEHRIGDRGRWPGHDLIGHAAPVLSIDHHPDLGYVVSADAEGNALVWDPHRSAGETTLRGHENDVWCVAWDDTGERLASSGRDGLVVVWDLGRGAPYRVFDDPGSGVDEVLFTGGGTKLMATSHDGFLHRFDLETGVRTGRVDCGGGPARGLVEVERDGDVVYVVGTDRGLITVDGSLEVAAPGIDLDGGVSGLAALTANDVVAVSLDGTIRRIDAVTGDVRWKADAVSSSHFSIAVSDDRDTAAIIVDRQYVALIDIGTGEVTKMLEIARRGSSEETLVSVSFGPDRDRVTASSSDGSVHVWDVDRTEPLLELEVHDGFVVVVACDVANQRIVTGGSDCDVRILHSSSSMELREAADRSARRPSSAVDAEHADRLTFEFKLERAWSGMEDEDDERRRSAWLLAHSLMLDGSLGGTSEPHVVALTGMRACLSNEADEGTRLLRESIARMDVADPYRARASEWLARFESAD